MPRSRTDSRPKARMPASRSPAAAPTQPRSRALEGAILALSLVGAALSVELALLHARAHAGGASSFCAISERVNCDTVALSPWSVALGVPLAAWGALAYLAVAGLS
ncbi:MAG TPA: vitamin K epoxide reductase family protein, partial [Gemmatimonadales bacterium]|nr:vitamin K epoxide reductase family protein [Gemmatimonadales bacterium]